MELELNGYKVSGNAKDIRKLLEDNEDSFLDNSNKESSKCKYCDFARPKKGESTESLLWERCKFNTIYSVGSIIRGNFDYPTKDPELVIFGTLPDGYKETSFNINYCPICGRKLR